jgi:hypothetical protein
MILIDQVEVDVDGLKNYFLPRPLLNGAGEFSFATVSEIEICDAIISIRSDAAGVDTFFIRKIAFACSSACADLYL